MYRTIYPVQPTLYCGNDQNANDKAIISLYDMGHGNMNVILKNHISMLNFEEFLLNRSKQSTNSTLKRDSTFNRNNNIFEIVRYI